MDKRGVSYLVLVCAGGVAVAGALLAAGPGSAVRTAHSPGGGGGGGADGLGGFVNWETAQVHPVDLTPDGSRLLVCNTADARLEVFDVTSGTPVLVAEIPVGLDPVSVRARSNTEAWVANTISDSVSIVSLNARNVVATIKTADEPSDVVFASTPAGPRAFVSCSRANLVEVFDPTNPGAAPTDIAIRGNDPRALAVSPDGATVYAAVFNSGNATTILGGGALGTRTSFPPNVVGDVTGPYAGVNPPPNAGNVFAPAQAPGNPAPPAVGLIVRKDTSGHWMDDNSHDWTPMVSGANAGRSGRPVGWDLPDRDLAAISTSSLAVSYASGLMNICAAAAVNPGDGSIAVVGTDAINQLRFEPNVDGVFVRVHLALVNPVTLGKTIRDLNPHLTYAAPTAPQTERDRSIGDPRGIAWNGAGTRAYITGMGSNNLIVVNSAGDRAGLAETIPVGRGPTGVVVDEARSRLYVLNRFDASVSVVSTTSETVLATVSFFDPTPSAIKAGRPHLYDTHATSGLGQAACGSCHIDARMDGLAWDLGNPAGTVKQLTGSNLGQGVPGLAPPTANPAFAPWHPMKGPMTTQTLQDIVGKEPFHWRGDRFGLEEFNGAFQSLLGDDTQLTAQEMQEFEDFLASIYFPPNPFRNFDNTMPQDLALPPGLGLHTTGRFGPAGQPLPTGHPNNGLALYTSTTRRLDGGTLACVTCHTLPTGAGTDTTFNVGTGTYSPLAVGPFGEHHASLVSVDGSTNITIKIPQIRNAYLKFGFDMTQTDNTRGFGFLHDGSIDTLARFVDEPVFNVASDQETADLVAFIMCMSGSDLPPGSPTNVFNPPGTASHDVPASVGQQTTLVDASTASSTQLAFIAQMTALAQANKVGLIVKGLVNGEQRGFAYLSNSQMFQSDRQSQVFSPAALQALAHAGSELTYTVVPKGTELRTGIDRNADGVYDRDQADLNCYANCDGSHIAPILNVNDFICFQSRFAAGDAWANCDGSTQPPILNVNDFICFQTRFAAGCQ